MLKVPRHYKEIIRNLTWDMLKVCSRRNHQSKKIYVQGSTPDEPEACS